MKERNTLDKHTPIAPWRKQRTKRWDPIRSYWQRVFLITANGKQPHKIQPNSTGKQHRISALHTYIKCNILGRWATF